MVESMTTDAKNLGLDFHFDKAILANSYKAHGLLHLAQERLVGKELKQLLFKAYLSDGENFDDNSTLIALGEAVGISRELIESLLNSDAYEKEVKDNIAMALQIGVQGVPFFVFDNR